jgi:hypothetical protein
LVGAGFHDVITLNDPDEFFAGVVEVKLDLNVGVNSGLITSELELFNEVLMRELGETTTFISVKIDVVDEEGGSLKRGDTEGGTLRGE